MSIKVLTSILNQYGFKKAYYNENSLYLAKQSRPLSLNEWFDFETLIKLNFGSDFMISNYNSSIDVSTLKCLEEGL